MCPDAMFLHSRKVSDYKGVLRMLKKMMKAALISMAAAALIFCVIGVAFDLSHKGTFSLRNYQFTKMFIGAAVVGLGFSLPSLIYEKDSVPRPLQVIFHMGIGCAVLLVTGFTVGWIPVHAGIAPLVLTVAGEILAAFILWKGFAIHYRKEAEEINEQLRKREENL